GGCRPALQEGPPDLPRAQSCLVRVGESAGGGGQGTRGGSDRMLPARRRPRAGQGDRLSKSRAHVRSDRRSQDRAGEHSAVSLAEAWRGGGGATGGELSVQRAQGRRVRSGASGAGPGAA